MLNVAYGNIGNRFGLVGANAILQRRELEAGVGGINVHNPMQRTIHRCRGVLDGDDARMPS